MELQQCQKEMIKNLKELKNHLLLHNAPINFINLINDCIEYISIPIPVAELKQEDLMPVSDKPTVYIEIKDSTLILSPDNITDYISIPPSLQKNNKNSSNGGI